MGKLDKIKKLFPKKKTEEIESPQSWVENRTMKAIPKKKGLVTLEIKSTRKIRLPWLRNVKRVIATLLFLINFFISQATLLSAPATQPLFWLFLLNSFILLDYIWRTRKKTEIGEVLNK